MTRKGSHFALVALPVAAILVAGACTREAAQRVEADTAVRTAPAAPETVPTVLTIRCTINKINPPELMIDVEGQVPTGGWTSPELAPRVYVAPPADGIWDYDFTALRPSGPVPQVLTAIDGSHTWPAYPAATLKGVRVHGVGAGVKEASLAECGAPAQP